MKEAGTKTFVGVRLDDAQIAKIDALAKGKYGLKASRSEVIRMLIDHGLQVVDPSPKDRKKSAK